MTKTAGEQNATGAAPRDKVAKGSARKRYEPPLLTPFGDVRDLTLSGTTGAYTDGASAPYNLTPYGPPPGG